MTDRHTPSPLPFNPAGDVWRAQVSPGGSANSSQSSIIMGNRDSSGRRRFHPVRNLFRPQPYPPGKWSPPPPLWAIILAIIISIPIIILATNTLIHFYIKNYGIRVGHLKTKLHTSPSTPPNLHTGLAPIQKLNLTWPTEPDLPSALWKEAVLKALGKNADYKGLPNLHIYSNPNLPAPPERSENEVALIPKPSLTCPKIKIINGERIGAEDLVVSPAFLKFLEEWHNQQHRLQHYRPSPIKSLLDWIRRQVIFMYDAAAKSAKYFLKMMCNCHGMEMNKREEM